MGNVRRFCLIHYSKEIVMAKFEKGCEKIGGRKRGTPNRSTTIVKSAVLKAFDKLGGVEYLVEVGREDPKAFMVLLAKILPAEIRADVKVESGDLVTYLTEAAARVLNREKTDATGKLLRDSSESDSSQ